MSLGCEEGVGGRGECTDDVALGGVLAEDVSTAECGFAGDCFGDGLEAYCVGEVAFGVETVECGSCDFEDVGE